MKGRSKVNTCRLPPIHRTKQNKMHHNYKMLQQKKVKWKSRERVCELGPNNCRLQIHQEWDCTPCKRKDGRRRYQLNTFSQEEGHCFARFELKRPLRQGESFHFTLRWIARQGESFQCFSPELISGATLLSSSPEQHYWTSPEKKIAPQHARWVSFTCYLLHMHSNFIHLQLCPARGPYGAPVNNSWIARLGCRPGWISREFLHSGSRLMPSTRRLQHSTTFAQKPLSRARTAHQGMHPM